MSSVFSGGAAMSSSRISDLSESKNKWMDSIKTDGFLWAQKGGYSCSLQKNCAGVILTYKISRQIRSMEVFKKPMRQKSVPRFRQSGKVHLLDNLFRFEIYSSSSSCPFSEIFEPT